MNVDELLREAAPDRSPDRTRDLRSAVLARAVVAAPARRWRAIAGGLTAAVLGLGAVGGVAYATGGVPTMFPGFVDDFGRDNGVPAAERPELTQVVDLTLPDGSRFAAWAGANEGMWCVAYLDRWDGRPLGSGGAGCGDAASRDLNRASIAWAQDLAGSTHYPVLFGEADATAVEVRVTGRFSGTGQDVSLTLPVAGGWFAGVLPGTSDAPWADAAIRESGLTLEFLAADGTVLRTAAGPPV